MTLSRAKKKKIREGVNDEKISGRNGFTLTKFGPRNDNQEEAFRRFSAGNHLVLHGFPGTGKTFVGLYLALDEIFTYGTHSKLVICRSAVPTREIGFLKGSDKEKAAIYETPYRPIFNQFFGRGDAYDVLKNKGVVEFMTTSFVRGITLDDSIVVLDEAQNMSEMELHSLITRLGENSRLIICGDLGQDDLTSKRYSTETGLAKIINILKRVENVTFVNFTADDILRSDFVRDYIIAKQEIESEI